MSPLLLDCALKATAIFAGAALAARLLRDRPAALRHSAWLAALVLSLALVPLASVRPIIRVPILPAAPVVEPLVRAWPSTVADAESPASLVKAPPPARRPAASDIVAIVWLAGTVVALARIARSRLRLGRLRRAARPMGTLRVGPRVIELLSSPDVASPVAFGIRRPAVMLPADAGHWPAERLEVVLAHETAHHRRRDPLAQLVAELARAVHWYQPLVHLAVARLADEREHACDDEVVAAGRSALDYAEHLVSLAAAVVRPRAVPAGVFPMAQGAGLEARVVALLSPGVRRGPLSRAQSLAVAAPSLGLVLALAVVSGVRATSAAAPAATFAETQPATLESQADREPTTVPVVTPAAANIGPEPPALSVDDPMSERIAPAEIPSVGPNAEEIAASPERAELEILLAASHHVPRFEHDLIADRAAWALTRVRGGRIVDPLTAALDDEDWRARAYAAWGLAAIGAAETAPRIAHLLEDSNWRVRAQASSSLLGLGADPPLDVVARLAADPAWQVRVNAIEFLGRSADTGRARTLLAALRDDPHAGTRIQAEAALSALEER